MNRLGDIFRMAIISPEFAWACILWVIYSFFGDWLGLLGMQFKSNSDVWKALYGLPLIFTGFAFKASSKLRYPLGKEENKALYEWPEYHRITDRVIFSLFLCMACSLGAIGLWVFTSRMEDSLLAAVYLAFAGLSGITTLLLILAEHKLKEILTKNT